ncbi:hypothetical protein BJ170DRAFT_78423 [Xylariales sp. AK1849]|nr:hypothetical protein BJ170DRAFT_78423 [Xylariales sp. AK1849]
MSHEWQVNDGQVDACHCHCHSHCPVTRDCPDKATKRLSLDRQPPYVQHHALFKYYTGLHYIICSIRRHDRPIDTTRLVYISLLLQKHFYTPLPPPIMCKTYLYLSTCRNLECQHVVEKKHRNRYCPKALDIRRLGRCLTGVVVARAFLHRGSSLCRRCKAGRTTGEATIEETPTREHRNRDDIASLRLPCAGLKRKAKSLMEFASDLALDAESREVIRKRKRKRCPDAVDDGGPEDGWLEVLSPVGSNVDTVDDNGSSAQVKSALSYYGFDTATPEQGLVFSEP